MNGQDFLGLDRVLESHVGTTLMQPVHISRGPWSSDSPARIVLVDAELRVDLAAMRQLGRPPHHIRLAVSRPSRLADVNPPLPESIRRLLLRAAFRDLRI